MSVTHKAVAIATALILLVSEIGSSVGGAIGDYTSLYCQLLTDICLAVAIWSNSMPRQLNIHLPFLNDTECSEIYGSITIAAQETLDSPTRQGVIAGTYFLRMHSCADDTVWLHFINESGNYVFVGQAPCRVSELKSGEMYRRNLYPAPGVHYAGARGRSACCALMKQQFRGWLESLFLSNKTV